MAVHWVFTSHAACLAAYLPTCYQTPACLQAFAEEVTNLQKQDAGPEELQQKLVQVGWSEQLWAEQTGLHPRFLQLFSQPAVLNFRLIVPLFAQCLQENT